MGERTCWPYACAAVFLYRIRVSKHPNYRLHGLLRASHFHNPSPYSHIVKLTLHFYVHMGRVKRSFPHHGASTD